jgi:hypothetical protein
MAAVVSPPLYMSTVASDTVLAVWFVHSIVAVLVRPAVLGVDCCNSWSALQSSPCNVRLVP